jgi:hypothetical protein
LIAAHTCSGVGGGTGFGEQPALPETGVNAWVFDYALDVIFQFELVRVVPVPNVPILAVEGYSTAQHPISVRPRRWIRRKT